jgi:hypothetical protein
VTFARHAPCPGPIAQEKPCESAIPEGSRSEFRTLIGAGPRLCVLPRIHIPRTSVNKGKRRGHRRRRQSNLQQSGAQMTHDGTSGLSTSLLSTKFTPPALSGGSNRY